MEDITVTRRKLLRHSSDCPMKNNIFLGCRCHYDDCLNYKGSNQLPNKCICEIIDANSQLAKANFDRQKRPFFIRIFIKKPRLIDFIG